MFRKLLISMIAIPIALSALLHREIIPCFY